MIEDRYSLIGFHTNYLLQARIEEINKQVASLTNEGIYSFLRKYFDEPRGSELEGIDPVYFTQEDSFGQTMLHWAAVKGDLEITSFIIEKTKEQLFNSRRKADRYTALHLAVHGGNHLVIELLIGKSKEFGLHDFVNATDAHGQTALHWAASKGNLDACGVLYENMSSAAIVLQMKDRQQTALHFAIQGGHLEVVGLLLSKPQVVLELLTKCDKYGQSVLHWATGKPLDSGKDIVDLLIKEAREKLSPESYKDFLLIRKLEGYTALHISVHSGSNESIKLLVAAAKDRVPEFISLTDEYDQTALHWAASKNNEEACQILCDEMSEEKVALPMKDRKETALHFAVQGGDLYLPTISILLKTLKDRSDLICLVDANGWNILHWAVQNGSLEVIKKLLSNETIRDQLIAAEDIAGRRPIDLTENEDIRVLFSG